MRDYQKTGLALGAMLLFGLFAGGWLTFDTLGHSWRNDADLPRRGVRVLEGEGG